MHLHDDLSDVAGSLELCSKRVMERSSYVEFHIVHILQEISLFELIHSVECSLPILAVEY